MALKSRMSKAARCSGHGARTDGATRRARTSFMRWPSLPMSSGNCPSLLFRIAAASFCSTNTMNPKSATPLTTPAHAAVARQRVCKCTPGTEAQRGRTAATSFLTRFAECPAASLASTLCGPGFGACTHVVRVRTRRCSVCSR
eukprot:1385998-Prymnesium_polylepis.1